MKASQKVYPKHSVLQENVIPPSEVGNLTQTLVEQFPYSTLGLRPRVEYGNSSPRVWVRITILLPPSEGGMHHSHVWSEQNKYMIRVLLHDGSVFHGVSEMGAMALRKSLKMASEQKCVSTFPAYLKITRNVN